MKIEQTTNFDLCSFISPPSEKVLLISFFFISFLFFKFFVFKESESIKKERETKSRLSKEYLEQYKQENEDFFYQSEVID